MIYIQLGCLLGSSSSGARSLSTYAEERNKKKKKKKKEPNRIEIRRGWGCLG
jgi:hypothetical protein